MSVSIQSHTSKRTNFQFTAKYQGSNLALAGRRAAVSDKTPSQVTTMLPTRSSSSGEPRKPSKSYDVQQLALSHCLPCLSARPHVISTSINVRQLTPFHRLPCLSDRKRKAKKFTDVQQHALHLHLPPLSNGLSNLLASPNPTHRPMKTRTIMGLHLHPFASRLGFWLTCVSLLTPLAVIDVPPLCLTSRT
jgi:hypothetical protein